MVLWAKNGNHICRILKYNIHRKISKILYNTFAFHTLLWYNIDAIKPIEKEK
nr:MAG TPA: hypothetical protein [Bacteriophage sp.]